MDKIKVPEFIYKDLFTITSSTGITSMRTPYFTIKVACALAALRGVKTVEEKDLIESLGLTISHKMKHLPETPEHDYEKISKKKKIVKKN